MKPGRQLLPALWILVLLLSQAARADGIERIEPPNWWVGMAHRDVQLMVHGPGVAAATVRSGHADLQVLSTERETSPNHLFVNLRVRPGARARSVPLHFRWNGQVQTRPYELQARQPGSAQRRGFGPEDTLLNLMPDRFANGDPANDVVPGYGDKLDRGDKDAGRHGGDLEGLIQHLDYIAGMGYTMIWPTPLLENRQPAYSYHGYSATDLYRVDPRFGSNADYRRFVQEAGRRGMGVIHDYVPNHIGSGHWWLRDLPSDSWLSHAGRFVPTNHARTSIGDRYASERDREGFTRGWFVDTMPDPNQRNPRLATYLIQNAVWWIEAMGLSGLRVDTFGYSDKAFLAAFAQRVLQEYPRLNLVGEEWSSNPVVVSYWLRGRRNADGYVSHMPSMMDFPLHETLRRALVEPDTLHSGLTSLYEALVNDALYPEPRRMVLFEGNHDVPRLFSALNEDLALWKMALVYLATAPRTPQLYYGTELLMTSPKVRDDGAVRLGFPGGWAGDTVNARTGAGLTQAQLEAQAFQRRLFTWRKTQPAVHHGQMRHFVPEEGSYVFFRFDATNKVMVVLNKAGAERVLDLRRFAEVLPANARGTEVLSGRELPLNGPLAVPARTALVIELKPQ